MKRKRRSFFISKKKKSEKRTEEILMKNKNYNSTDLTDDETVELKHIKGTKKKKTVVNILVSVLILALIVTLLVAHLLSPTGLIEKIQNSYEAMGKGELPISVFGSEVDDFTIDENIIYCLSSSYLEIYNSKGKNVFSYTHNYSEPVLKTSEERCIIYDRGRSRFSVYNYSSLLYSNQTEYDIISADISRNGTVAVATFSDNYNSEVNIYNKNNEKLFTWYSSKYTVTDVTLTPKGDMFAVTLIDNENGQFVSYVYVFDLSGANPKYTYKYNDFLFSVDCNSEQCFYVNGYSTSSLIKWNSQLEEKHIKDGYIQKGFWNNVNGLSLSVSGTNGNQINSNVILFDDTGEKITDLMCDVPIEDVAFNENYICILSNDIVNIYEDGIYLNNLLLDKNTSAIEIDEQNNIFGLSNKLITQYTFEEE